MKKKYRIWIVCTVVVLFLIILTPSIHRHVRREEGQIIPKVTVTDQIHAVPNDDIKQLLKTQPKTTLIILNAKNTKLNQKFDKFINQNQNLGLPKTIYIVQELYHNKTLDKLNIDKSVINIVQFEGETPQAIYPITSKTAFDQSLIDQLKKLSAN
ncbi:hypothetical protein FACS1894193_00040 [Bacilli bacterium]|nr:hypothetical protein FACS1894193_00040 [Bacilli bacterium]